VTQHDATSDSSAGPVAETDPPGSAGPLRPSAPPPDESLPDEAQTTPPGEEETGEADALESRLEDEIQELASQRDEYRDLAQRVQADFENYRKRVQVQIRDEADRASGRLAEAMLPVLDATEAAYLRHPDEVGPLLNVMLSELRKQGLEALHLQDQPFDPNVAEAVAHEAGEGGDVVVAEVLRSGYVWNGRTLRPAMVRTRD
jgi:molecular chaperone GrpE